MLDTRACTRYSELEAMKQFSIREYAKKVEMLLAKKNAQSWKMWLYKNWTVMKTSVVRICEWTNFYILISANGKLFSYQWDKRILDFIFLHHASHNANKLSAPTAIYLKRRNADLQYLTYRFFRLSSAYLQIVCCRETPNPREYPVRWYSSSPVSSTPAWLRWVI